MADALASGASVRKDVGVQVPPRAPTGRDSNFMIVSSKVGLVFECGDLGPPMN